MQGDLPGRNDERNCQHWENVSPLSFLNGPCCPLSVLPIIYPYGTPTWLMRFNLFKKNLKINFVKY